MSSESRQTERDREQDEMIRRNAESIRRNEEAILRQTKALEQIRDHYFPKRTLWSQLCGAFLKAVGAVTVAAGILEAADWYLNTRQTDTMAEQCAAVANRLFEKENAAAGALKFLEKAVELDSGTLEYRIRLESVKSMVAINDMFDLERPLTADERRRVDRVLGCRCGEALLAYGDIYAKAKGRMGNSTELYYLLKQGKEYKRAAGVTDETLAAALEQWHFAESLFDPSGAQEWVKDDFLMLDLLYRAVEMRIKTPGKVNFRASFEPEYRRLWLRQNRVGGLDLSLVTVFGR